MNNATATTIHGDQLEDVDLERDCPCGAPAEYALLSEYIGEGPAGGQIVTDDFGVPDPYVCEACALDVTEASEIGTRLIRLRYGPVPA